MIRTNGLTVTETDLNISGDNFFFLNTCALHESVCVFFFQYVSRSMYS